MSPPSTASIGRLRGRRTFAALREHGTRRRSGPIVITAMYPEGQEVARVAYAIPRAVGPAVTRNRLRRRLRAVTRELALAPGEYLVSAAPAASSLSFEQLTAHVRKASGQ